jgi:hypothetical protein
LLVFSTQAKIGAGEQAIDDVVVLADAVIDELAVAFRSDQEERRRIANIKDPVNGHNLPSKMCTIAARESR